MKRQTTNGRNQKIIGCRIGDLHGLLDNYLRANPCASKSKLVRRALLKELKPYAGKRWIHLYKEVA